MSDKRELLALLTCHGTDPGRLPGVGVPAITQMDVAGMMSRLGPGEAALLRAKYCGEHLHNAWSYWFPHLMNEGWEADRGQIDVLSRMTLVEHVSDNRCGLCSGTQGWYVGTSYQTCPLCEGSGVQFLTASQLAERLGIKRLATPWTERLEWCRKELVSWEHSALDKMR